jgi:VIT1/CCC1 family predicted Fe2+/Mn2+ transporter
VGVLPPLVASVFNRDDLERVRAGLLGIAEVPAKPSLTKADWTGALAVFLLVFLSTFPIVIPFLLIGNLHLALRVSNGIALAMLFITGWVLARHGGHNPWWTGLAMTLVGVVLVGVTIALGG